MYRPVERREEHGDMTIEAWRQEIDRMDRQLSIATGRIRATAEDSELRVMRQVEADAVNWRLAAYQLADYVLEGLYGDLESALDKELYTRVRAQDDTAWFGKLSGACGVAGLMLLLITGQLGTVWWLTLTAVVLLVGAAASALLAMTAHRDVPEAKTSLGLAERIHAIERACTRCQDIDDFNQVKALLAPPSTETTPLSTDLATRWH